MRYGDYPQHDCLERGRDIANAIHWLHFHSILETAHAYDEVSDAIHIDVEYPEHCVGCCVIDKHAHGCTCRSRACADYLRVCLEFDGGLHGWQRRQRKRHQLQGQLVDTGERSGDE